MEPLRVDLDPEQAEAVRASFLATRSDASRPLQLWSLGLHAVTAVVVILIWLGVEPPAFLQLG